MLYTGYLLAISLFLSGLANIRTYLSSMNEEDTLYLIDCCKHDLS